MRMLSTTYARIGEEVELRSPCGVRRDLCHVVTEVGARCRVSQVVGAAREAAASVRAKLTCLLFTLAITKPRSFFSTSSILTRTAQWNALERSRTGIQPY